MFVFQTIEMTLSPLIGF